MRSAHDSRQNDQRGQPFNLATVALLACVVLSAAAGPLAYRHWAEALRNRVAESRLGSSPEAIDQDPNASTANQWHAHADARPADDAASSTPDQPVASQANVDGKRPKTLDATPGTTNKAAPTSPSGSSERASLAPLPDDGALKVVGGSGMAYQWITGSEYGCRYELSADHGDLTRVVTGMVTYQPTNVDPATVRLDRDADDDNDDDKKEATGTAFVVHPDGALVTCAHVVLGATEIQVHLGGKTLTGRVVALDKPQDLAVVRVAAKDLPYVPLGNSDELQLAQEIRVIGYPLSDVLGESVKASRGEISGLIKQEHGGKLLQIDATVNPGNSGGPVVDEHGRVVGVASALITGARISAVGFGIPSNDALALLTQRGIKLPQGQGVAARLSGTELVKRVSPAVALLKVKLGPGGVGGDQQKVVDFHGVFSSSTTAPGGFFPRLQGGTSKADRGRLVVNAQGEVSQQSGSVNLPYLLGPLGQVGIEVLSEDGSGTWSSRSLIVLREVKTQQRQDDDFPFGMRPPRPGRPGLGKPRKGPGIDPFGRRPETTESTVLHPAVEQWAYKISKTEGDIVHIDKTWEIKTVGEKDGQPYIHASGKGTLLFDKRQGIPQSADLKASFRVRGEPNVPLTLTVTFLGQEEMADLAKKSKEARERAIAEAAKRKAEPPRDPVRKFNEAGGPATPLPPATSGGLSQFDPDGTGAAGTPEALPQPKEKIKPARKPARPDRTPPGPVPSGSGGGGGLDKFDPER